MKTYLKYFAIICTITCMGIIGFSTSINSNTSVKLLVRNIEALASVGEVTTGAQEKITKIYESYNQIVSIGGRYNVTYDVTEVIECKGKGNIPCEVGIESCKIKTMERDV